MKTTIEISDDLFERTQRLAREQKTTFRALTETGLRLVLAGNKSSKVKALPPLVTFRGQGLSPEFANATPQQIRDEFYKGHGA